MDSCGERHAKSLSDAMERQWCAVGDLKSLFSKGGCVCLRAPTYRRQFACAAIRLWKLILDLFEPARSRRKYLRGLVRSHDVLAGERPDKIEGHHGV